MMKKIFTFFLMIAALIGTVNAQNKTTMLEVHDFIGFVNGNTPTIDGNRGIVSLNGRIYGSWIDGEPRFTLSSDGTWQTWHQGGNDNNPTYLWAPDGSTFTINGLFAGDVVTVVTYGNCSVNGNSLSEGTPNNFTMESDGSLTINCNTSYPGIQKVSIATQRMATYEIVDQTYRFLSGGVLPDKRKAVPYITMSFGNEYQDFAYVKYYGVENNQKQFGSFILTETMDDTYFKDYGTGDNYYEYQPNWNNENGPYVLKEPVVFKGANFSEYVPWHGTYYYFYPETNGKLYVHMHSDPVTAAPLGSNDVMFIWDKTSNDGGDAYSFNYNTEDFYTFGSNAQNGVRVKKNHVYFMCTTPNDARRRNVAHLIDYTFVPDFTMSPLYAVIEPGYEPQTSGQIAVSTLAYTDNNPNLHYRVKKCLGNIESATVKIENNQLYFTSITYKSGKANKGGAVIVDVDCTDGQADFVLTVPYSAEPIDGTGNEVKKWDFYSNIIDNATVDYNQIDNTGNTYQPFVDADAPMMGKIHLGQWKDHTDDNDISSGSGLFYETQKDPGEWLQTYINLDDNIEPIFKNVYDIEGDNADMIWDTNGLVFHAHSNLTGIYNENYAPSSAFQDRYIGLMKDGEFVIPRLTAGDRIVIKMGTYGNLTDAPEPTTLTITNAKDAVGTAISGDYVIGGSAPIENDVKDANNNYVPRGEYHFSAAADGDVTFKVRDGQLLKLYTIQIYKNSDIVTENEILGDPDDDNKCYILNTQGADTNDDVLLHAHYNGLNEPFSYHNEEAKTGNITGDNINVGTSHQNALWYTYSIVPQPKNAATEKFGVFKVKIGVKDLKSNYVTDYASCMVPVGYLETMEYPYTWDFTDLKKYVSAGIDEDGVEKDVDEDDLKIWDEYGFRTNSEEYDGYIFAPGGQLYGGTTMFDETRGIGIFHNDIDNKAMTMDGRADAADGGLAVSDEFGFVVPQVEAGQAVYVHATAGDGTTAQYAIGNGEKQTLKKVGTNAFAMKMADDATTANVTLYFKGCEVNKIAVSDIAKSVNDLGYASESRAEEIDPELMGYMTGSGLKAYIVTAVNYGEAGSVPSITLSAIEKGLVMGAAEPQDNHAYIIYNTGAAVGGSKKVNAAGDGFHLFVPDMHDKTTDKAGTVDVSNNSLRSWLTAGRIQQTYGDYTVYLMNSQGYNEDTGAQESGVERFYRASSKASLGANKAYLLLETAKVKPSGTNNAKGMFEIVFVDEEEGTETTSLDGVESIERIYNDDSYYTLGGVKVQNPTKKGIYIKNGKKIIIK